MDALDRLLVLALFALGGVFVGITQALDKPKPREYPRAYCIDPFASVDLNNVVYTDCRLVPMWSMKV